MATKKQTLKALADLDHALSVLAGEQGTTDEDRHALSETGNALVRAARRFNTQAGADQDATEYDDVIKAADNAIAAARDAKPGDLPAANNAALDAVKHLEQATSENERGAEAGTEKSPECCREDFDAQRAVLSLSRDIARLTETVAKLQADRGASSALRSAALQPTDDVASAENSRVDRLLAAIAPDRRDRYSNSVRQLVQSAALARRRAPDRPDLMTRIVGGNSVQPGSFLHCVCVGDPERWMCTGALVSDRIVLTAAHCGPNVTRVMIGGNDVFRMEPGARVIKVSTTVHPAYRRSPYSENDISVLVLAEPATQDPIGIASRAQIADAEAVHLVGFGYNDPQRPDGFGTKREVQVDIPPIIRTSGDDGLDDLEGLLDFHGEYEFVTGRKGLGRDTCNGDSGGPAYILAGQQYRLAGLTSRATQEAVVNCGDGGIYVRPEHFRDWIDGIAGNAGAKPISWQ